MPIRNIAVLLLLLVSLAACRRDHKTQISPVQSSTLRQAGEVHHIKIGTAVRWNYLREPEYAEIVGSEFSQVQDESEMKFAVIHPASDRYDFSGGDEIVSFAQAHNMVVRGHTLIWHHQVPHWISQEEHTPAKLSEILHEHITAVVRHYAGKVYAWDVVNEAFNDNGTMRETVWYNKPGIGLAGMGTQYVEQAFQWAHAADPNAKLFYNDYDAEPVNAKSDAIYAMARDFKERGVPLDGIGFQLHVTLKFDNPQTLSSFQENLRRFAALGLEIHFTELDIRLKDASPESLIAQAKLYGEIATICVEQPACKLLQTWGFTDKYSWIPNFYPGMGSALLWNGEYQKKPAYFAVMEALQK